jgi:hypothetical protein
VLFELTAELVELGQVGGDGIVADVEHRLAHRHLAHRVGGQHLEGGQRRRVDEGTDRDAVHPCRQLVDAALGRDNRSVPVPEPFDGGGDAGLCGLQLRQLMLDVGFDPIERRARAVGVGVPQAGLDAHQCPGGDLRHPPGFVIGRVLLNRAHGGPGFRGGHRRHGQHARDDACGRPAPRPPTDISSPSIHLGTRR